MHHLLDVHSGWLFLVMEYSDMGDLEAYYARIQERGERSIPLAKEIFLQLLSVMGYLLINNIIHRGAPLPLAHSQFASLIRLET